MGQLYQIEEVVLDATSEMVDGSLANKVSCLYGHIGAYGEWYAIAGTPSATHKADRVGVNDASFQIDAGNDDWGAWVQILGSADTPHIPGTTEYHLIKVIATAVEHNTSLHFMQVAFGATGADALTANTYSDLVFVPLLAVGWETSLEVHCGHIPVGTLAWARCKVDGQNTGTVNFYFSIIEV